MHQEVVTWSLPDNLKVIHKGGLKWKPIDAIESGGGLSHTCPLIFVAGRLSQTANPLWLEVRLKDHVIAGTNRGVKQRMELAGD